MSVRLMASLESCRTAGRLIARPPSKKRASDYGANFSLANALARSGNAVRVHTAQATDTRLRATAVSR